MALTTVRAMFRYNGETKMSPIQGIIFNLAFFGLNCFNLYLILDMRPVSRWAFTFVSLLMLVQLILIGWYVSRLF